MSNSNEKRISKKQLTANRGNAKKSTGAKTVIGKQVSSRNGLRFGLHAKDLIINSAYLKENRPEYDFLLQSLYDQLNPTNDFQEFLVHKIANCLWRSRRAYIAETATINNQLNNLNDHTDFKRLSNQLNQIPELPPDPDFHDDMQDKRAEIAQARSDIVKSKTIPHQFYNMNILYYEMRLDRQLSRYYKMLRNLQGMPEIEISDDFDEKT